MADQDMLNNFLFVCCFICLFPVVFNYDLIQEALEVPNDARIGNIVPLINDINDTSLELEKVQAPKLGQCSHRCLRQANCSSVFYNSTSENCRLFSEPLRNIHVSTDNTNTGAVYINLRKPTIESPWSNPEKQCTQRGCTGACRHDTNGEAFCLGANAHCPETPSTNLKHYFFGILNHNFDSAGFAVIEEFSYNKTNNESGLRVSWIGTLRGNYLSAGTCRRFYLTFNEMECGNPDTIEYIHHEDVARDFHRPSEITGICEGIPAGNIKLELRSSPCLGYTTSSKGAYVGWHSNSRAIVEETDMKLGKATRAMEVATNYNYDTLFKSVSFPSQSTSYYISSSISQSDLTKFTTCAWIHTSASPSYMTVISYSYNDGSCVDNGILMFLYPTDRKLQMCVGGTCHTFTAGMYPFNDGFTMHQLCFMWENSAGEYKMYMDGVLREEGSGLSVGKVVKGTGTLVIGQDQDSCGGSFDANQAYSGWVSRVNIWDHWLEPWAMGKCYSSTYGNWFKWAPNYVTLHSLSWSDLSGCSSGNIPTFGGNGNNLPCWFPFSYNGGTHYWCVSDGRDRPWCSVTDDYERDGLWGYCEVVGQGVGRVQKTVQTYLGSSHGAEPCKFPFDYSGKTYDRCAYHGTDYGSPWCYTASGTWGFCRISETEYTARSSSNCPGHDVHNSQVADYGECMERCSMRPDCKAVAYRISDRHCWLKYQTCESANSDGNMYMYDKVFRESIHRTFGGNSLEAQCIFPFVYQNITYHTCITDNHNVPWCATTPDFDEDGKWGNCILLASHYTNWRRGDCSGNDISPDPIKDVSSADECENHCNSHPECRTSLFRPWSMKCWKKYKSCMTPSSVHHGKAIDRFEVGRFYVRRLGICTDYTISPYQSGESFDHAEGCRYLCDSLPDCKAFYYDNSAKKCYPQSQECEGVLTSPGCGHCFMFNRITQGKDPGSFHGLPGETVLFWSEPSVSTSEYAKLLVDSTPEMEAITVCLWMRTRQQDGTDAYLISYANSATVNQFFIQLTDGQNLVVYVAGSSVSGLGRIYLTDYNWHHMCFTWDNALGDWSVYIDGLVVYEGSGVKQGSKIGSGGTWILGQRQGSVGGSFSGSYSYIGYMTRVNIWNAALPASMMSSRCSRLAGNIYAWDTNTVETHSLRINKEHLCSESEVASSCAALSVFNVQQYTVFNFNNGADGSDTMLMKFDYTKREERTALRVYWSGSTYVTATGSRRWVVRFSGRPCYQGDIEGMAGWYSAGNSGHRTITFDGICEGVPAGRIRVELYVDDNHRDSYSGGGAHSGWNTVNRFIVEEIRLKHDVNAFRGVDGKMYKVPTFNIHHWKFVSLNKQDAGEIASVSFKKKSSSSSLRVRWVGALKGTGALCGRWYFTFNGAECNSPGSIDARTYNNPVDAIYHSTSIVDGICEDFGAQDITIAFNAAGCADIGISTNGIELYAGYSSVSSITVSEVNTST